MSKKVYIISFFILVSSGFSNAQLNQKTAFGNLCAIGSSIMLKDSMIYTGGFACQSHSNLSFITRSFIAKFDLNGNPLFIDNDIGDSLQNYECRKIIESDSGNYFIIGGYAKDSSGLSLQEGIFIQKRTSFDQVVWTKEYYDSLNYTFIIPSDADLLENGNIAITGWYGLIGDSIQPGNPNFQDTDVLLAIFDQNGNHLLTKRFGNNLSQDQGYSIKNDGQNTILLGGDIQFDQVDIHSWIIKCDYQGNLIDDYVSTSNRIDGARGIVSSDDGGVIYASRKNNGQSTGTGFRIYVEKLDSNLNSEWTYEMARSFNSMRKGSNIELFENGDILIGGSNVGPISDGDSSGFYGFLQRLSPTGDSLWHRYYGILNNSIWNETHQFYDIEINGGIIYAIGESIDLLKPNPPQQEMWLVSVDTNGCPHPTCIVGFEDFDEFENLKVFPNPVKDILNVHIDDIQDRVLFSLYDLQGRLQFNQVLETDKTTISLSGLPQGLYIYDIRSNDQVIPIAKGRGKIVKE